MTQARCRRAMTPAPASVPATRPGCSHGRRAARRAPMSAGARSTASPWAGPGHLHGPARRDRHRARACAVAGGRSGRRLQPARARRGRALHERRARGTPGGIDARRGEVFAAAYDAPHEGSRRRARARRARWRPRTSRASSTQAERRGGEQLAAWLAVGDGAIRFRGDLESAGVAVPRIPRRCTWWARRRYASSGRAPRRWRSYEEIVPDYRRRPDAEIALEGAWRLEGVAP